MVAKLLIWRMLLSKYLVSGAGGFLGFYLTKKLASQGHDVVAVDIDFKQHRPAECWNLKQLMALKLFVAI